MSGVGTWSASARQRVSGAMRMRLGSVSGPMARGVKRSVMVTMGAWVGALYAWREASASFQIKKQGFGVSGGRDFQHPGVVGHCAIAGFDGAAIGREAAFDNL